MLLRSCELFYRPSALAAGGGIFRTVPEERAARNVQHCAFFERTVRFAKQTQTGYE
jgi:hypothetical protein